jgi:hypothetical protein
MSVFFFTGPKSDFPMVPYFVQELDAVSWNNGFRVVSKKSFDIFARTCANGSNKKLGNGTNRKLAEVKIAIKEKRFDFAEKPYLEKHLDVSQAIKAKQFKSGLAHYLEHGLIENRDAQVLIRATDGENYEFNLVMDDTLSSGPSIDFKSPTSSVRLFSIASYEDVGIAAQLAVQYLNVKPQTLLVFADSWLIYDVARLIHHELQKKNFSMQEAVAAMRL